MRYALIDAQTKRVEYVRDLESPDSWQYPDGFELVDATGFVPVHDIWEYYYENGSFVWHESGPGPLNPTEVLTAIFSASPETMDALPDEALARMAPYMEEWEASVAYSYGDKRSYNELPYRCLQAHTSQAGWNPADAPSLWARILIPDPTVIPDWEQPGSTNPYMKGDKVKHNGKVWVSDIDNNVWEPGVYGWSYV